MHMKRYIYRHKPERCFLIKHKYIFIFFFCVFRACVGIKVEPNENEDWFCRACISRKQSDQQLEGKKKKRKKKDRESKNL